jgi:hypothetical protein
VYVEINYKNIDATQFIFEKIIECLTSTEKSVVIIAPNSLRRGYITQLILEHNIQFEGRIITSYKMLPKSNTYVQFIDDFTKINEKNLFVDDTAYYFGYNNDTHSINIKPKTLVDEIINKSKTTNELKINNKPKLKLK